MDGPSQNLNFLLTGGAGYGKTYLARAFAGELGSRDIVSCVFTGLIYRERLRRKR